MLTFTVSELIGLGWEPSTGIFASSPIDPNILLALKTSGLASQIMKFHFKFMKIIPTLISYLRGISEFLLYVNDFLYIVSLRS